VLRIDKIMKQKLRHMLVDSVWSIMGLVIMNMVLQLVVYKFWNMKLGNEINGDVLTLMAYMNIFSISAGTACNYLRMRHSQDGYQGNTGYLHILWTFTPLALVWSVGCVYLMGVQQSTWNSILFALLSVFTMWRYYADVEYKLSLHYKQFFMYYLAIAGGYLLGSVLFWKTGMWPLGLLPGEIAGVLMVTVRGKVFRREHDSVDRRTMLHLWSAYIALMGPFLLNNVLFNGDRILLQSLLNGTNVTLYYQASGIGKLMALLSTPLNGVMIGYLARFDGQLSRKLMKWVTMISLGVTILATAATTLGAHIYIRVLYPDNYLVERPWFLIASLTQVLFFVASSVTVVLLRFSPVWYQTAINIGYGAVYAALCISLTRTYGFSGFAWGLLGANTVYMLFSLLLGWRDALRTPKDA